MTIHLSSHIGRYLRSKLAQKGTSSPLDMHICKIRCSRLRAMCMLRLLGRNTGRWYRSIPALKSKSTRWGRCTCIVTHSKLGAANTRIPSDSNICIENRSKFEAVSRSLLSGRRICKTNHSKQGVMNMSRLLDKHTHK